MTDYPSVIIKVQKKIISNFDKSYSSLLIILYLKHQIRQSNIIARLRNQKLKVNLRQLPKIEDFCNYENRRFSVIARLLEYLALFGK
jgi:hypothetical protein